MKSIIQTNYVIVLEAGEDAGDSDESTAQAMAKYTAKITADLEVNELPEALDIGIKVLKLIEGTAGFMVLCDLNLSGDAFDTVVGAINEAFDSGGPGERIAFAWSRPDRPLADRTHGAMLAAFG